MTNIERYVDPAMYPAAPMEEKTPKVHLLSMSGDPLGEIASACRMYKGETTKSLGEITDEERMHYWAQVGETHLKAPLEFVKLHFFFEGVTRAFTHQLVRQRTAVYAQESLRFAVKEDLKDAVRYPPSLTDEGHSPSRRNDLQGTWDKAVDQINESYLSLVANGVPAEDARGLLPTDVLTRVHYSTDLRNLLGHAGNRLCTQAQFEWRAIFLAIVDAISNYEHFDLGQDWQGAHIANSGQFAPACYEQNKCPFQADFDRGCTIRDRVDINSAFGVKSGFWEEDHFSPDGGTFIPAINRAEWLSDPKAGWVVAPQETS